MRQGFLLIQEAMVAEIRAARLDLYARTKFTKEGREITESRALVDELLDEPGETAARTTSVALYHAAARGLIEMG